MSEPNKHPVDTPREWIRYADGDFQVASREMQTGKPVFHTICFLCQSAAEKYLKGFLISRGWKFEKTKIRVHPGNLCSKIEFRNSKFQIRIFNFEIRERKWTSAI